jgi:hypothetical protein
LMRDRRGRALTWTSYLRGTAFDLAAPAWRSQVEQIRGAIATGNESHALQFATELQRQATRAGCTGVPDAEALLALIRIP